MDRFFPVKKAVETVTAPDLVAAILFFRCAEQKWTAEPPGPIFKNWSWWSPTTVLSGLHLP